MQVGRLLVAVLILAAGAGCGSSSSDDNKTTSSPVATAGNGAVAQGVVACGGQTCSPLSAPGLNVPLQACCSDAFTGTCGNIVGSSCRALPPAHPTCPSVDLTFFVYIGCCTNGQCGVTGGPGMEGGNCVDLATARMGGMGMGMGPGGGRGFGAALPEPQSCDQ